MGVLRNMVEGGGVFTLAEYLDSQGIVGGVPTLASYGTAVGDGVIDCTGAITAAEAAGGAYVGPGAWLTTKAATQLNGKFWGLGQIKDSGGNKRGPFFSAVKAAPASNGNWNGPDTAFNGDLSRVQVAMEHRITGAATLGQPTTGYSFVREAYARAGFFYNSSGWNQDAASNTGRTAAVWEMVNVTNAGQGDAMAFCVQGIATATKAGATSFLANPAVCAYIAGLQAGAVGCYLNPIEISLQDAGIQSAAAGCVINLSRTVATATLNEFWGGYLCQSKQSSPVDFAFSASGAHKVGLDLTRATFSFSSIAIALKPDQRIAFAASTTAPLWSPDVNGGAYIEYNTGLAGLNFLLSGSSKMWITANDVNPNVPVKMKSYTVATLPASVTAGYVAYASNGRKAGEGAGAGTGVLVFADGIAWRAVDTGATVAA